MRSATPHAGNGNATLRPRWYAISPLSPHAGNGNATLPLASSFDRVLASDRAPLSVAAAATCVQPLRASQPHKPHKPQA